MTGAVVGALALAAAALVVLALRPPTVERPPVAPFEIGVVAASGDTVWRWVGPSTCNADADVVQLERSEGGGPWEKSPIPLANVYSLSFSDGVHGVATGTTSKCARGVALTANGGRTWRAYSENPVLLDAWYTEGAIWGVERVVGTPQIAAFKADKKLRLKPIKSITPARPCSASDGVPNQVAFWTDKSGLLLCQNTVIDSRLLARTTNGSTYEALTDDRPTLGLDGAEPVIDIDVAGTESVWAVFAPGGGGCSEGQVRYSDSQGAVFSHPECPSRSVDIDEVLDVAFTSDQDGVMLALRDRQPVMATTDDAGDTWTEQP
ncbi:MAG TPA: hypothetical protein VFX15_08460 [Actinomycetes bacterium]|nr:hypothetical protein [Actinomycetes bacterium]